MIASLQGKITLRKKDFIVLEVSGVGYKVFLSEKTLNKIPQEGQDLNLFTYFHLKETAAELYGFLNPDELELFETLNGISGIGPKTATALASLGSLEKLKETIEKGELSGEIKGIGRKRAQKILLELTGKIKELEKPRKIIETDEELDALLSLGFPRQKAKDALSQVPKEIKDPQKRIKEALKFLGR